MLGCNAKKMSSITVNTSRILISICCEAFTSQLITPRSSGLFHLIPSSAPPFSTLSGTLGVALASPITSVIHRNHLPFSSLSTGINGKDNSYLHPKI